MLCSGHLWFSLCNVISPRGLEEDVHPSDRGWVEVEPDHSVPEGTDGTSELIPPLPLEESLPVLPPIHPMESDHRSMPPVESEHRPMPSEIGYRETRQLCLDEMLSQDINNKRFSLSSYASFDYDQSPDEVCICLCVCVSLCLSVCVCVVACL